MKFIIKQVIGWSITYWLVTFVAWSWALGLSFDWWKGLVIGLINSLLNLVMIYIINKKPEDK